MQPEIQNRRFADFKVHNDMPHLTTVSRITPEGFMKSIGYISADYGNGECPPVYQSLDNNGDDLFPETENYAEAESNFESYAKRLTLEFSEKSRKTKHLQTLQNEGEIKSLRIRKGRNEKAIGISK